MGWWKMTKILRQFIIKKLRDPVADKLDEDIEWVCNSFGFVTLRDRDKTAFRILKALIGSAKENKGLTSEELAECVEPTIGSVIYHLRKLMKAGLVVKLNSSYELRMNSFFKTIEEIEREIIITLTDIKKIAKDIDKKVGLENRM
jgi:predicted transcriptional regulator